MWFVHVAGGLEEESVADGRLADVRARLQHALADQKYRENELASLRSQIRLLLQAGPAAHANRSVVVRLLASQFRTMSNLGQYCCARLHRFKG